MASQTRQECGLKSLARSGPTTAAMVAMINAAKRESVNGSPCLLQKSGKVFLSAPWHGHPCSISNNHLAAFVGKHMNRAQAGAAVVADREHSVLSIVV